MAEKDITEKILLGYNDVAADVINVFVFHGSRVVQPEDLEDGVAMSAYPTDDSVRWQERDVLKYWKNRCLIRVAAFGFENESVPERDMVLRAFGYDGASYRGQLGREKDEDGTYRLKTERYPVITLVLYFGYKKRWDQPKTLHELLGDRLTDKLKPFVSDYRINVCEVAWLDEETVQLFRSDFRIVADFFRQLRINGDYVPGSDEIAHVREVLQLLSAVTKNRHYEEAYSAMQEENQGEVHTMMSFLEKAEQRGYNSGKIDGYNDGKIDGERKGRKEGAMMNTVDIYRNEMGYSDETIADKLAKRFNLALNDALAYVKPQIAQ